ncbi:MAG: TonB-dependent receptor [Gammaproteobacteria bacterium]
MHITGRALLAGFISASIFPSAGITENLPTIEVVDSLPQPNLTERRFDTAPRLNAGEMLSSMPGANLNSNGPLTGIAQYRGYFGDRVNVVVGGTHLKPAGPNAMDAPLNYLPPVLADSLQLERGIARVSGGIETLGGTIRANPKTSEFNNQDEFRANGLISGGYSDINHAHQAALFAAAANRNHRFHLGAARQRGGDYVFDGGEVTPSEHDRDSVNLGYGFRSDADQKFSIDYRYNDTGETGTAAVPMDIIWVRSDLISGEMQLPFAGDRTLKAVIDYQDSQHLMDNYSLRNPPVMMMGGMPMPMNRHSYTDVISYGLHLSMTLPLFGGTGQVGVDGDNATHNATIGDPTNAMFFVDNFNNAERNLASLSGEWNGHLTGGWQMTAGARITHVETDADTVAHSMAMMNPRIAALRDRFNSADRSQSDTNVDLALELRRPINETVSGLIGFAHKERAPSYQERYLWVPLQSTGGLADGNTYVGSINLDPEQAEQFELGLEIAGERGFFNPRIFYHRIDDYIQGTPATDPLVTVQDPTALQFSNVDAELTGLDLDWMIQLNDRWLIDGVVSYVRGERRDISDDLYRIAPLNAFTSLHYQQNNWHAQLQLEAYASQSEVSVTNREAKSAGYGITHLKFDYRPQQEIELTLGINNLFDKKYQPHLGGSNRVMSGSDLAPGERIPEPGRNLYLSATMEW